MTYTSSEAFAGRGTKTLFNGVEVPEVRAIQFGWATAHTDEYLRLQLTVEMNYIWGNKVQQELLDGMKSGPHDVELELPFGRKVTLFRTHIDSSLVSVEVNDAVKLTVVFAHGKIQYSTDLHNVEDGPEVDIIPQLRTIRDEDEKEIRAMIRRIVRSAAIDYEIREFELWRSIFTLGTDAYDFEDLGIEYPLGGGFTQVHDSHSYHYTPETTPLEKLEADLKRGWLHRLRGKA